MLEFHTCIYCCKPKERNAFNKDHVIPRCFGSFDSAGFTLINTVCWDCNQYFGDTLELSLGRDTLEGVARYSYEIFPGGKPKYRRLILKIDRPGPLFGMLVSPKPQILEGLPEIELLNQVGFFNTRTEAYEYVPESDIPKSEELEKQGFDFRNKEIKLVGDQDGIRERLAKLGYPNSYIKNEELFRSPEEKKNIPVSVKSKIDRTISRGMAKIAFNYLAYVTSKTFVLGRDFERIRRYIRYDEGDFDDIFRADKVPILRKEKATGRRILDGHIIVMDWNGDDLVCTLSIFNSLVQITYYFWLCRGFRGFWIPACYGHYFNVGQGSIRPLYNIKMLITFD